MTSMMVWPASFAMALVTSSLVSRAATDGSTGTSQAQMAARTRLRASAAAAGRGRQRDAARALKGRAERRHRVHLVSLPGGLEPVLESASHLRGQSGEIRPNC